MTERMTMNRVIHAAVRRDLDRLDTALATAPDGDRGRAEDLRRAYANLARELTHHHQMEDRLVFPAVAGLDPEAAELLKDMESEHHAMSDGLVQTAAAMDAYAATGSAADAASARDSLHRTQAVVDRHLRHEEDELEPKLAPHLASAEWKAVEKEIRKQPVGVAGPFMAWLQDGMDEDSRAFLRSTVPPPVTYVLSRVAGRRYHREIAPVWTA